MKTEKKELENLKEAENEIDAIRAKTFQLTHHLQLLAEFKKYEEDSIKLLFEKLETQRKNLEIEMYNLRQLKIVFE